MDPRARNSGQQWHSGSIKPPRVIDHHGKTAVEFTVRKQFRLLLRVRDRNKAFAASCIRISSSHTRCDYQLIRSLYRINNWDVIVNPDYSIRSELFFCHTLRYYKRSEEEWPEIAIMEYWNVFRYTTVSIFSVCSSVLLPIPSISSFLVFSLFLSIYLLFSLPFSYLSFFLSGRI